MQKDPRNIFVRMGVWKMERFPPLAWLSAAMMVLLPKAVSLSIHPYESRWDSRTGFLILFCITFLFLLRILDEHKDFESDLVNHQGRTLQRGVVTLGELRVAGVIALILHLWSIYEAKLDATAWMWVGITWAWTALMTVEFFARKSLRQNIILYSTLHLLVSPVVMMVFCHVYQLWNCFTIAAVSFFSGAIYEVARKTKAPEAETEEVSFSKLFGIRKAQVLFEFLCMVFLGCTAFLFWSMGIYSKILGAIFLALFIGVILSQRKFKQKNNEGWAALLGSVGFLVPVIWMNWFR